MQFDYRHNNGHIQVYTSICISLFHAVSTWDNKCELLWVSRSMSMSRSFDIKLEKISEFYQNVLVKLTYFV